MIYEFNAEIIRSDDAGGFTARLVPFNTPAPYGSRTVEFVAGSITIPDKPVPLTLDHGDSVLDRIGVMKRSFEASDGLYAEFTLADTQSGREVRELLAMEAVTDVSVGVELSEEFTGGVMRGVLDHTAVVPHGRFGQAAKASKVLAVHDEKEPDMAENEETAAPVIVEYDDGPLKSMLAEMSTELETMKAEKRRADSSGLPGEYVQRLVTGGPEAVAEFGLAADDTTGAAGIVPDYLASEVLSIIDTSRPLVSSFAQNPIGPAGMSIVYPRVTQKPTMAVQSGENTEPSSTMFLIDDVSYKLDTIAGANQASVQVIERSDPSYVNLFYQEMAGQYAIVSEQTALATLGTEVTQTEILADASADPAATIAALAHANTQIVVGVRRPATSLWVGAERWEQFLSLVTSSGNPLVTWPDGGPSNAFGTMSLSAMQGVISGLSLILVPNMDPLDMYMGWSGAAANLEQSPQQLQAMKIDTLSWELGVYGYYAFAIKYPKGFVRFTVA